MSKKNLPNELSYEELIAALDAEELSVPSTTTATEEDLSKYTDDSVVLFLAHFNITQGDKPVNDRLLHDLYKKHVPEYVDRLQFNIKVGKYLLSYTNRFGKFYRINLDAFKITEEYFKLKTHSCVKKDRNIKFRKKFEEFLTDCEITTGQYWVQGFIIYEIYREYLKRKGKKTVLFGYKSFIQLLKVFFSGTRRTSNRSLWFNVNKKTFEYYSEEQKDSIEKRRSKKKRYNKRKLVE